MSSNGKVVDAVRVVAPHSVEAEEAVLGSILINPNAIYDALPILEVGDFFIVRHGWIYDAMRRLHARRVAIDHLSVAGELRDMGRLDEAGGPVYLTYLITNTPTSVHAASYAEQVRAFSVRKRLLEAAETIARLAHATGRELADVVNGAEAALSEALGAQRAKDIITLRRALTEHSEAVLRAQSEPDGVRGLPTGFADIDAAYALLQPRNLVIVAGRTGMGKTSWLLNVFLRLLKRGQRPAIFSLEMACEQLMDRLVSVETGIDAEKFRTGKLDAGEMARYLEANERLKEHEAYIDDTSASTITALQAKCKSLAAKDGVDAVFVDYVQLMHAGRRMENRVVEVGEITMGLKQLARDLSVPVIAAAQVNRAPEAQRDKRPGLADLRESGSIENDADAVLFLYRDDYYDDDSPDAGTAEVLIKKNRHGATGVVRLSFQAALTRFGDLKHIDANAIPW